MANVKLGTKAVGSIVKIKVNGASKDFIVVQQGNPNTSTYDSSCNGTWLLMKDIYTTSTFGNNNSYKDSSIHTYLNGTFYNLIDSNIRAAIKQVKIPYQNGTGSGGSLATGSNGLSTKVFLLSGYEVGWTTSDNGYFPEGRCSAGVLWQQLWRQQQACRLQRQQRCHLGAALSAHLR